VLCLPCYSMADATNPNIEIRELRAHSEFAEVVHLQREIWGFQDVELLPLRLFVVASKIGGQLLGAFAGTNMIGFCLCIPGLKPGGKAYLHSHMLGVLPPYRNTGLGRKMKLKQREFALARGVDLIEWTFDPLEIKNAFFNIERLGAIARRYVHNQYGTTSSHLHGGLPTDRLIAEWWIASDRVRSILDKKSFQRPLAQAVASVPIHIARLRKEHPAEARAIQSSLGEQLAESFRTGLAAIGFEKNDSEGRYLLGAWPSP